MVKNLASLFAIFSASEMLYLLVPKSNMKNIFWRPDLRLKKPGTKIVSQTTELQELNVWLIETANFSTMKIQEEVVWKVSAMCFCTAKKDLNQEIFQIPKWLKIVPVAEPTFLDKIIKMHKKGSSPEFSAIINLISHKVEKLIFQYFQGQKLLKTPKYQAGQK